jgi:hypothetical protein
LPRFFVPLVIAVVVVGLALVVIFAGLGGRNSKQNTGDVGRINTSHQNQAPQPGGGISRHGGGTTP